MNDLPGATGSSDPASMSGNSGAPSTPISPWIYWLVFWSGAAFAASCVAAACGEGFLAVFGTLVLVYELLWFAERGLGCFVSSEHTWGTTVRLVQRLRHGLSRENAKVLPDSFPSAAFHGLALRANWLFPWIVGMVSTGIIAVFSEGWWVVVIFLICGILKLVVETTAKYARPLSRAEAVSQVIVEGRSVARTTQTLVIRVGRIRLRQTVPPSAAATVISKSEVVTEPMQTVLTAPLPYVAWPLRCIQRSNQVGRLTRDAVRLHPAISSMGTMFFGVTILAFALPPTVRQKTDMFVSEATKDFANDEMSKRGHESERPNPVPPISPTSGKQGHEKGNYTRLEGGSKAVSNMVFSPDCSILAVASDGGAVRIWDIHAQRLLYILDVKRDFVSSCAFSADGKALITNSDSKSSVKNVFTDNGIVEVWDIASGKRIQWYSSREKPGLDTFIWACYRDGDRSVVTGGNNVQVWDAATFKETGYPTTTISDGCSLCAPAGGQIASWRKDGIGGFVVEIHNLSTGNRIIADPVARDKVAGVPLMAFPMDFCFSHSGTRLVYKTYGARFPESNEEYQPNSIVWWNLWGEIKKVSVLPDKSVGPYDLRLSPNGELLATRGDKDVQMWTFGGKQPMWKRTGAFAGFSSDDKFAIIDDGGRLQTVDALTGKDNAAFANVLSGCSNLVFSPDGRFLAAGESKSGNVRVQELLK